MVFENGVKNIQAAAYNGARTVYTFEICTIAGNYGYLITPEIKKLIKSKCICAKKK